MTYTDNFKPAAAIFDMDGLMLDTERICMPLWEVAGRQFGYDINYDIYIRLIGINGADSRKLLCEIFGQDFPYDKIIEYFRILLDKIFDKDGIPHKSGLVFLLERLYAAKIPMAVATSTRRVRAVNCLTKAGIINYFNDIVCGDEIKNGKPAPDIFLLAAEKLGIPPSLCAGFEDSIAGLKALYAANIHSVFIKDLVEPPQDVLATVWRRCNDLAEAAELFGV